MRHSWTAPDREPLVTYRNCRKGGLVKVTRHDGPFPWQEFMRDGVLLDTGLERTPKCEGVKPNATVGA